MDYVIVNQRGELYCGMVDGKPHFLRTKRPAAVMQDEMGKTVMRQLLELGFGPLVLREANNVSRKWVPAETDATEL